MNDASSYNSIITENEDLEIIPDEDIKQSISEAKVINIYHKSTNVEIEGSFKIVPENIELIRQDREFEKDHGILLSKKAANLDDDYNKSLRKESSKVSDLNEKVDVSIEKVSKTDVTIEKVLYSIDKGIDRNLRDKTEKFSISCDTIENVSEFHDRDMALNLASKRVELTESDDKTEMVIKSAGTVVVPESTRLKENISKYVNNGNSLILHDKIEKVSKTSDTKLLAMEGDIPNSANLKSLLLEEEKFDIISNDMPSKSEKLEQISNSYSADVKSSNPAGSGLCGSHLRDGPNDCSSSVLRKLLQNFDCVRSLNSKLPSESTDESLQGSNAVDDDGNKGSKIIDDIGSTVGSEKSDRNFSVSVNCTKVSLRSRCNERNIATAETRNIKCDNLETMVPSGSTKKNRNTLKLEISTKKKRKKSLKQSNISDVTTIKCEKSELERFSNDCAGSRVPGDKAIKGITRVKNISSGDYLEEFASNCSPDSRSSPKHKKSKKKLEFKPDAVAKKANTDGGTDVQNGFTKSSDIAYSCGDIAIKVESTDDAELHNYSSTEFILPDTIKPEEPDYEIGAWRVEDIPKEKRFQCDLCNKRFARNYALTEHLRIHSGEKPFTCIICGNKFTLKRNLKVHILTHSDYKPYKCQICSRSFSENHRLLTHIRMHEEPFKCDLCPKTFTRKFHLTVHMRSHLELRPYSCDYCEKRFSTRSNAVVHMRLHTGQRPYICSICDKSFIQKGALNLHILIHSKVKPFSCIICNKKFTLKCRLAKHMKVHLGGAHPNSLISLVKH